MLTTFCGSGGCAKNGILGSSIPRNLSQNHQNVKHFSWLIRSIKVSFLTQHFLSNSNNWTFFLIWTFFSKMLSHLVLQIQEKYLRNISAGIFGSDEHWTLFSGLENVFSGLENVFAVSKCFCGFQIIFEHSMLEF
jgi:hypothetical protein